jgi:hypothetical protein
MEKANFREMLYFLKEQGCPMLSTRQEAGKFLDMGQQNLRREIAKGRLKLVDNKIPIGSIASYLCG